MQRLSPDQGGRSDGETVVEEWYMAAGDAKGSCGEDTSSVAELGSGDTLLYEIL